MARSYLMSFRLPLMAVLAVALLPAGAPAQERPDTIKGIVFDEVAKTPLSGATVVLLNESEGTPVATARSDATGRYRVPVSSGTYWLVASHPGYASSPPLPVSWGTAAGGAGNMDGVLLNLRTLDRQAIEIQARAEADAGPARVLGRVLDGENGRPLVDAEIRLEGSGLTTVTDENGMFALPEVPAGLQVVHVQHLAYGEQTRELVAEAGTAYEIQVHMSPAAMEIEGIEVSVVSQMHFRQLQMLQDRMKRGLGGSFVLAEDLKEQAYPLLPEALRMVPGLTVKRQGAHGWHLTVDRCASKANAQTPVIYVDGVKVYRPSSGDPMSILNEIASTDVEAMEVYKGASSVPPEFSGSDAACGAIVIWTKRGG